MDFWWFRFDQFELGKHSDKASAHLSPSVNMIYKEQEASRMFNERSWQKPLNQTYCLIPAPSPVPARSVLSLAHLHDNKGLKTFTQTDSGLTSAMETSRSGFFLGALSRRANCCAQRQTLCAVRRLMLSGQSYNPLYWEYRGWPPWEAWRWLLTTKGSICVAKHGCSVGDSEG